MPTSGRGKWSPAASLRLGTLCAECWMNTSQRANGEEMERMDVARGRGKMEAKVMMRRSYGSFGQRRA
ncbi:unnamed protein product [Caretta caretta]